MGEPQIRDVLLVCSQRAGTFRFVEELRARAGPYKLRVEQVSHSELVYLEANVAIDYSRKTLGKVWVSWHIDV